MLFDVPHNNIWLHVYECIGIKHFNKDLEMGTSPVEGLIFLYDSYRNINAAIMWKTAWFLSIKQF